MKDKKFVSTPFKVDPVTGQVRNLIAERQAKESAKSYGKAKSYFTGGKVAKSRIGFSVRLPPRSRSY